MEKDKKEEGGIRPSSPFLTLLRVASWVEEHNAVPLYREERGERRERGWLRRRRRGRRRSVILRVNGHAERLSHAPLTDDLIRGGAGTERKEKHETRSRYGEPRHPQSASSLSILLLFTPLWDEMNGGWLPFIERRVHWDSWFWSPRWQTASLQYIY